MRRMDPNAKQLPPLSLGDLDDALGRVQPRCGSASDSYPNSFVDLGIPCIVSGCARGQRLSRIKSYVYGKACSHVETCWDEPARAGGDLAMVVLCLFVVLTGRGAGSESRCGSTARERGLFKGQTGRTAGKARSSTWLTGSATSSPR